jgi:molybdopterin synthase catalytic subunit
MYIRVLYYGVLRERYVGSREEKVLVPAGTVLAEFTETLCQLHPGLGDVLARIKVAVNEEFAAPTEPLRDGDVIALLPPVAGGAEPYCRLTEQSLDLNEVVAAVAGPTQGGIAVFIGTVRNHNDGHEVVALEYDAYPEMVLTSLERIVERCQAAGAGIRVAVAHRYGALRIGDAAVVVAASAAHRAEAFAAARECIELLKQDTPIWKREVSPNGVEWTGMGP